ncbi:MAG: agmatinase [Pseudomonadota bacterium]
MTDGAEGTTTQDAGTPNSGNEDSGTEDIDRAFASRSPYGMSEEGAFAGALSFLRRPYTKDATGADVVVSGVPYDLAVTNRPGTRFGPRAIREASAQMAWPGGLWPWPANSLDDFAVVDWGDMAFDFGAPEKAPEVIEAHARKLIETNASLVTLGGDHFITYPLLKAHAAKHGPLALVQFDAHSDTWREDEKRIDHGTMFFHAVHEGIIDASRSVQIGIRTGNPETHGLTIIDADAVHARGIDDVLAEATSVIGGGPAYLTFDIDCLDPAFAPGTGTPVCGGLATWQARKLLQGLGDVAFVGMDLVEVSQPYDQSQITALAAAMLLVDYICLRASQRSTGGAGA